MRENESNGLSSVSPIDPEIGVHGPDTWTCVNLSHANKTGVRKVHRQIVVFVQQTPDAPSFGPKVKHDPDDLTVAQLSQCPAGGPRPSKEMQCFRQDCLASQHWGT